VVEKPVVGAVAVHRSQNSASPVRRAGESVISSPSPWSCDFAHENAADKGKSIASASSVRTDGYLATNAHVVARPRTSTSCCRMAARSSGESRTDAMKDIAS